MTTWKIGGLAVLGVTAALVAFKASLVFAKDVGEGKPTEGTPLAYTMKDIDGKDVNLADYKGKVVLIVNVASKCGFTKQYAGLEALYKKYEDKGFVVLGFPANDFKQEAGSDADIKAFCSGTYDVTFPVFSKVNVKGADQTPLYKFLTDPATAGDYAGPITWNFNKFLVDKQGHVVARYASATTPQDDKLVALIEKSLAK